MELHGRISKGRLLAVAGLACAVVVGSNALVSASIPDADGTIHGCYLNAPKPLKALVVVDPANHGGACPVGYRSLNFNQRGPRGPAGPAAHAYDGASHSRHVAVTVPAGTYVVTATARIFNTADALEDAACTLDSPPGLIDAAGAFLGKSTETAGIAVLPLQGTAVLSSPGEISLTCDDLPAYFDTKVIAVAVGGIN